jgi:hypothetical protein
MTPAQAYAIASDWGSLVRSGDPGAVLYTFPFKDARPQSEAHRAQLMAYATSLIAQLEAAPDGDTACDLESLRALAEFFATSPLRGCDSLPQP